MAFTLSDLDSLEEALISGAQRVSYEGKTVDYRSIDDMLRLRTIMRAALGLSVLPSKVIAVHYRGYRGPMEQGQLYSGWSWGGV